MDVGAQTVEGFLVTFFKYLLFLPSSLILASCASSFLKYKEADKLKVNKEFENVVKIEKPPTPEEENSGAELIPTSDSTAVTESDKTAMEKSPTVNPEAKSTAIKSTTPKATSAISVKASPSATPKATVPPATPKATVPPSTSKVAVAGKTVKEETTSVKRQPELEDSEGFVGRRPAVDPFRVGEMVVHDVNYFKVSAGELRMKVEPFSTVNGRKSYSFAVEIKSKSLFDTFYSVDDRLETFVDYEDLLPRAFQLHVKESGQLREAKMVFDVNKWTATFWEKKVTKKDGEEEKKFTWDIQPYAQNVYSAIFYLRNFTWNVGKEVAFRVANDKDNMVFSAKAIRKEILKTKAGTFNTIVLKPNITLKGKFKPIGDNYVWITDDSRKYIVRIESKIKIGTLVSEVVEIKPGRAD